MKIGIIGVGYVGLVSGTCLSDFGHTVVCIDSDKNKIDQLNNGIVKIYEPGLEALIKKNVDAKRLVFKFGIDNHVKPLDVIFIAVGTPSRRGDGKADLTSLKRVSIELKEKIKDNQLIVIKSTVPVGTNRMLHTVFNEKTNNKNIELVSNPEFLREGSAIEDFMKPDRVIVGLKSEYAKKVMSEVYKPLYLRDFPIMYTDPESAEVIKYASNAFLATKISFINEVATYCEKIGADVKEVSKGIGLDRRIGDKFLHPGPGFGGSCFPKDTAAFSASGHEVGAPLQIIDTVIKVNSDIKLRMIDKIRDILGRQLDRKIISILGVTFKPNTDDMREAPSLTIIPALLKEGASIRTVDPKGFREGNIVLPNVEWFDDVYTACLGADLIVLLTEWNEFRALDLVVLSQGMRSKNFLDLRNVYSFEEAYNAGFQSYISVGRKY